MEAWLTENWQLVSAAVAAAGSLVIAVVYALNQMTRQITTLTGNMVHEVQTALSSTNSDRQLELRFLQQYLDDSKETRKALRQAQTQIHNLSGVVQHQASDLARLRVQVATGRNEADHALSALDKARHEAETSRTHYENEKKALMRQVADLTEEVNRLKGRVQSLEEARRQKQAALDAVTEERDALRARIAQAEDDKRDLLAQNDELQAQLADIREELGQLKAQLEARTHENDEQGMDGVADAGGGATGDDPGGGAGGGDDPAG